MQHPTSSSTPRNESDPTEGWRTLDQLGVAGAHDALRIGRQVADALAALHRHGRAHGDVSPRHIALNASSGALRLGEPTSGPTSIAYRAPECFRSAAPAADERCDLYALGVTLYQLTHGRLPLTAEDAIGWAHAHVALEPAPIDPTRVPVAFARVLTKLLAKTPEDRYQTARGLGLDLDRCLADPDAAFEPGADDVPTTLRSRTRLVGREPELRALAQLAGSVVERGAPELALVSGEAGVGKTSLIHAFAASIGRGAIWGGGRADGRRRSEPYLVFREALGAIVDGLMTLPDDDLSRAREALRAALGDGAGALAELVPDLERLLGSSPPVATHGAAEARALVSYLVRALLRTCARAAPLVVLIEDLQAADDASVALLRQLIDDREPVAILYLVTLRDRELGPDALADLRERATSEVRLAPLAREAVEGIVDDLFRCGPERATELAAVVHQKTLGNPLYVFQFLRSAVDQALVGFDHDRWSWGWDIGRLLSERPADNVADLLAARVRRLPPDTGGLVALVACLGHDIDVARVARLTGHSEPDTRRMLEALVGSDLLVPRHASYRFAHERVRDAAQALLDSSARAATHLAIGRDLLATTPPEGLAHRAFEIAGHLELAAHIVREPDELARIAGVFLVAARSARATAAFGAAATYCAEALALLGGAAWPAHPALAFELTLLRAQSAWPIGDRATSERLIADLLTRPLSRSQRVHVLRERIEMCVARVDVAGGVAAMLVGLRLYGLELNLRPGLDDLLARHQAIALRLGARSVEELGDLPLISDGDALALMDLLRTFTTVAFAVDRSVRDLFALEMIDLTLTHGMSEAAPIALAYYGAFLAERLGDLDTGGRYARLARALIERTELRASRARVLSACILVEGWTQPPSHLAALARLGHQAALETGDQVYACLNSVLIAFAGAGQGVPLAQMLPEIHRGIAMARELGFRFALDTLLAARQWVLALRGETSRLGSFDGEDFDEAEFLAAIEAQQMPLSTLNVAHFALQLRWFAGDLDAGWDLAERVLRLRDTAAVASPLVAWSALFAGMVAAARVASADDRRELEVLRSEHHRLAVLAARSPRNFGSKHLIVGAELARIDGDAVRALALLEQAVTAARAGGYPHDEAIACERAAALAAELGLATAAAGYLQASYRAYASWGATGKLRALEARHPELADLRRPLADDLGVALEAMMAVKASAAITGEHAADRTARLLMRVALEYAGARRGHLVLARDGGLAIAASFDVADAAPGAEGVSLRTAPGAAIDPHEVPLSLLRYVFRSGTAVSLGDGEDRRFATDPYFVARRPRSVLAVPIARAGAPIGVLFVDNDLTAGAFTATRVALVEHVAAQAVVALENARLFDDLRDAEERLRALVDHAPIAIFATDAAGIVTFARGRALEAIGQGALELVGRPLDRLADAEWLVAAARRALGGQTIGASGAIGACALEAQVVPLYDGAGRVVGGTGIVVDVTARARMTEELRALASELSSVADAERRELARELHDSVAQALPALKLELETLAALAPDVRLRAIAQKIGEAHEQIRTVMFELYPTILDDLGLGPALAYYARVLGAHGLEVIVNEAGLRADVPPERAAFMFRTAKELLRNAMKHARARRAIVTLSWREGALRLAVADDGVGFDPARTPQPGARPGFGLIDIRERVTHFGGRLRIESSVGAGTEVLVDIPLARGHALPASRPEERPFPTRKP